MMNFLLPKAPYDIASLLSLCSGNKEVIPFASYLKSPVVFNLCVFEGVPAGQRTLVHPV
jgi:hypothetical protein